MNNDFVSFTPFTREDIMEIFSLTQWLKSEQPTQFHPLTNKSATLLFEKPSLRTRLSFEIGIMQLGGQCVFLSQEHVGVATRESVRDIAEIVSGYSDLIVARTMRHDTVECLAQFADVPVVNALTDLLHPCQIMADAFTLKERNLLSQSAKITFIGDGNNVVNSWIELAAILPLHFVLACPKGYEPDPAILARAYKAGISNVENVHDPCEAAEGASVLYTDVWVSMGQEDEMAARREAFREFQINSKMLRLAKPDCVVMHCLPAHRGEEISAEVLEGRQSIVRDQAVNRLHVQKGILSYLFGQRRTSKFAQQEQSAVLIN